MFQPASLERGLCDDQAVELPQVGQRFQAGVGQLGVPQPQLANVRQFTNVNQPLVGDADDVEQAQFLETLDLFQGRGGDGRADCQSRKFLQVDKLGEPFGGQVRAG